MARRRLGVEGEARVAEWYVERGYQLIERNWRCRHGEIDVIVARRGVVVFCEVKTRTSSRFGTGLDAVTAQKQLRLRQLAGMWLVEHRALTRTIGGNVRFDVASVMGDDILVVEAAF